jgi:hypothetical protein
MNVEHSPRGYKGAKRILQTQEDGVTQTNFIMTVGEGLNPNTKIRLPEPKQKGRQKEIRT